ncbi:PucR C-terminal helix-turn-helix domain-containing protein [Actinomadura meyerae]|uniref:PucR C-terminal helix-turn-helix domain-containing protein n=1 Tax=Actinomadura meyerae TaxID=240840 RepID=A0A239NEE7_9ACTN|nr:helix-turn-helix domain-containing protein [Actinomadura meyerae]SNT52804.1 PucR C-terminal helix-turn-helix domain-containing protein [Actinomadura meyerae]
MTRDNTTRGGTARDGTTRDGTARDGTARDGTARDGTALCVAGRPMAAHLRARTPRLTRRVVARLLAELPVYAELPQEEVAGDIAGIVQHSLRQFADVLERRRPAVPEEFGGQRDSAAQRAEEEVPLDAILSAYQIGAAMAWEELTAGARPSDLPDLQEALGYFLHFQRLLISAVSSAYLEVRQIIDSQEHGGRHALMTALLGGDTAGHRPARRYAVLTLAFAPHPDEAGPGQRARIAARRKIRRIRTVLDEVADEPALTALDSAGGTALLPFSAGWDALRDLVARAAKAADTDVTAAAEITGPTGVPAAAMRTAEVMDLVRRAGRPPGLYRLADVLLDYQLSRPSGALPGLAALLAPLDRKPELLRTLERYLECDLDRRATGAALHVHPNTVAYRVRRISALTGLDPARPSELQLLNAALVARRSLY